MALTIDTKIILDSPFDSKGWIDLKLSNILINSMIEKILDNFNDELHISGYNGVSSITIVIDNTNK